MSQDQQLSRADSFMHELQLQSYLQLMTSLDLIHINKDETSTSISTSTSEKIEITKNGIQKLLIHFQLQLNEIFDILISRLSTSLQLQLQHIPRNSLSFHLQPVHLDKLIYLFMHLSHLESILLVSE